MASERQREIRRRRKRTKETKKAGIRAERALAGAPKKAAPRGKKEAAPVS